MNSPANAIRKALAPLCLLFLLPLAPQTAQAQQSDSQFWFIEKANFKLGKSWIGTVEGEQRFSDVDPAVRFIYLRGMGTWKAESWVDLTFGYEEAWNYKHGRDVLDETEYRTGLLMATFTHKEGDWTFKNREFFQMGTAEKSAVLWYRNKTVVSYSLGQLLDGFGVYMADEWLLDMEYGHIFQNRWQAGFMYQINENWHVDIYGMRVDNWVRKTRDSYYYPVFGLSVTSTY